MKKDSEPQRSKSGSDVFVSILLVIWAFFPSPVCICHGCISIVLVQQTSESPRATSFRPIDVSHRRISIRLQQTLESWLSTPFCPIDISHRRIWIRVGLRKVARVVSIRIVTSHILKKRSKKVVTFFCVLLLRIAFLRRNEKPIIALALLMSTVWLSLC